MYDNLYTGTLVGVVGIVLGVVFVIGKMVYSVAVANSNMVANSYVATYESNWAANATNATNWTWNETDWMSETLNR